MTKTWFEKYTTWRRRSNWPIHPATEYAYHAGRKHQREALRNISNKNRDRWFAHLKELKDSVKDIEELYHGAVKDRILLENDYKELARERNECRLDCDVLIQEKKREEENTKARQASQVQTMTVLLSERNEYSASCEALTQASKSLATERNYIQIQNGSLKNQIRILREMIVDLESQTWWQKLCCRWRTEW